MREQIIISGLRKTKQILLDNVLKTSLIITVNSFCHCDLATYLTVFHCLISMALAHVYFKHIKHISKILYLVMI